MDYENEITVSMLMKEWLFSDLDFGVQLESEISRLESEIDDLAHDLGCFRSIQDCYHNVSK